MIVELSFSKVETLLVTSILGRPTGSSPFVANQRQDYRDQAAKFFSLARGAAEQGQIAESAGLILRALDQERRAGDVGPQVMQLIKPRH